MEQLQQTLNEAIKMGWKQEMIGDLWISCDEGGLYVALYGYVFTYHELFSKDGGLMEFMEWDGGLLNAYKEMSYLTAKEKIIYFNTNSKLPNGSF